MGHEAQWSAVGGGKNVEHFDDSLRLTCIPLRPACNSVVQHGGGDRDGDD